MHFGDIIRRGCRSMLGMANSESVRRSAEGMIAAFRSDAIRQCNRQIVKMQALKDEAGAETWKQILSAALEMGAASTFVRSESGRKALTRKLSLPKVGQFKRPMTLRPTVLERAFDLAETQAVPSMLALRMALLKEGYFHEGIRQISPSVSRALARLLRRRQGRVISSAPEQPHTRT